MFTFLIINTIWKQFRFTRKIVEDKLRSNIERHFLQADADGKFLRQDQTSNKYKIAGYRNRKILTQFQKSCFFNIIW